MQPDSAAIVTVRITNRGDVEGTEVVQLYVGDEIGSVTTPVKALKGFRRVSLKPGESEEVSFKLTPESLSLWNRDIEPEEFNIMVGSASDDIRLSKKLIVTDL